MQAVSEERAEIFKQMEGLAHLLLPVAINCLTLAEFSYLYSNILVCLSFMEFQAQ
jgi:hypothetical protein